MKVSALKSLLEPFRLVCNPAALVPEHRVMQVTENRISGRTSQAYLDSAVSLGVKQPFAIEVRPLNGVAYTLPEAAEIDFEFKDNMLHWHCGKAKGRLGVLPASEQIKPMPETPKDRFPCSAGLSALFEQGAIACSNSALASVGLYGMTLSTHADKLWALSSDDITIAAACLPLPEGCKLQGTVTIGAPDCELLSLMANYKDTDIAITDKQIIFDGPTYKASIALVGKLRYDLFELAQNYVLGEAVHDIERDGVTAFVKRAMFLAEVRQKCNVIVKASGHELILEFAESTAQAQEMYNISEGFNVDEPISTVVDGVKLAKALAHCEQLILDHAARVLVLRSRSKGFHYMISRQGQ